MGFDSDEKKIDHKFEELKEHIKEEMKDYFRPEFLNRIDKTVVFNPLKELDLQKIVKLRIDELGERLVEKKIKLKLDPIANKWLAKKDFDANFGARAINRNIAEIEDLLAEGILSDKFGEGDLVNVRIKDDKLELVK
jgi:ATP-dependent Clp protease ATP-binding subunit ClpA